MKTHYQHIIIGGGLLGAATAYQLAKRGAKDILLLDRNQIASQASARPACLLTRARTKRDVMQLVEETYHCIAEIEELLGESLDVQNCGSVTIASSEKSLQGLAQLEEAARDFGIPCESLNREEVKKHLPWIDTSTIQKAIYMPTEGFVDSSILCSAYIRAAHQLGAEIRTNIGVKQINHEQQCITGITLEDGSIITSPCVINAAGAWANILMRPLGIGLPFTPVRSHFWITECHEELFPTGHPFAILPDGRAYTRSDVGALIIGLREEQCRTFNPDSLTNSIEDFDFELGDMWSKLDECEPYFRQYFPQLETTGIAHYVSGPSCYVPDATYLIGALPQFQGLYTVSGCCGGGVAVGGGMGRLLAELILGEPTFVQSAPFDPCRFGDIDPFSTSFQQSCADARSNKKGG